MHFIVAAKQHCYHQNHFWQDNMTTPRYVYYCYETPDNCHLSQPTIARPFWGLLQVLTLPGLPAD